MGFHPDSGAPLYQQVAADIRAQVESGTMPVGTQLPPHRQLARQYGVSVVTINKALAGLVSEGVLYSRVGRGTFVAVRPAATVVEVPARGDRMLGFVLRDLSSPFFSLVANAAHQRAHELGYELLLSSSANRADLEEAQIHRLRALGVQGLIIVSMTRTYEISDTIRQLHDTGFPYVMVSYTEGVDVPFIGLDLDRAGYLVGQHLVALGRRRFGYAGDRFASRMFELRAGGYRRAVREHGYAVDPAFVFEYPYEGEWNDYRSGYDIGRHIAALSERPDAMFVFNDVGAIGVLDGLLDAGVRVPRDVAVVGLDNVELAARARVPLTTVHHPADRIGAMAVDAVLARLRREPEPARQLLVPTLIVRRSCGAAGDEPLAVPAPHRSRALHSLKDRLATSERP